MMTTDVHALSGAYAVDALDDAERVEFEQHLAHCAACADEVGGLCEAATRLAALTEVAPPSHLRAAVLDKITSVRPLPPVVESPVVESPAVEPALVERPYVVDLDAARRRRSRNASVALVAAAVLAAVLIWRPFGSAQKPDAPVAQDPTAQTPSSAKPSPLDAVAKVAAAPDVRTYQQVLADGSRITWYSSAALDQIAVDTHDLAVPPEGKVYELWLQDDAGAMISAGFLPDSGDRSAVLANSVIAPTGAGITIEPEGGSHAPTSTPVTVVEFTA